MNNLIRRAFGIFDRRRFSFDANYGDTQCKQRTRRFLCDGARSRYFRRRRSLGRLSLGSREEEA